MIQEISQTTMGDIDGMIEDIQAFSRRSSVPGIEMLDKQFIAHILTLFQSAAESLTFSPSESSISSSSVCSY